MNRCTDDEGSRPCVSVLAIAWPPLVALRFDSSFGHSKSQTGTCSVRTSFGGCGFAS